MLVVRVWRSLDVAVILPGLRLGSKLMVKVTMNQFGLILRHIAFFLFPIPFLLGFAIEYRGHWTAYVAYAVIAVLVLGAVRRLVGRRGR
jgi:hypothetical protein